MSPHKKTTALIEASHCVLEGYRPMTLRQLYYQLVSLKVIENVQASYDALGRALVNARKEGLIPWDWIEDRLRRPRSVPQWSDLADFAETACRSYRRDVWEEQDIYLEAWLEKDALSGIFEAVLGPYGVTLNVGRGYDGWSSLYAASRRFGDRVGVQILYFGDFDPSGEDMVRSLGERLGFFECVPEIEKIAITQDDIVEHNLSPAPTKTTDRRREKFIARHGDRCVELDALPPEILEGRIRLEVEGRMDLEALTKVRKIEDKERAWLRRQLREKKRRPGNVLR